MTVFRKGREAKCDRKARHREGGLHRLGEEGRLKMKTYTLIVELLLAMSVVAQQAAQQPAQPVNGVMARIPRS